MLPFRMPGAGVSLYPVVKLAGTPLILGNGAGEYVPPAPSIAAPLDVTWVDGTNPPEFTMNIDDTAPGDVQVGDIPKIQFNGTGTIYEGDAVAIVGEAPTFPTMATLDPGDYTAVAWFDRDEGGPGEVLGAHSDPSPEFTIAAMVVPKGFVAEGDSITDGAGADGLQDYPAQTSRTVGIPLVANWAVSGEVVADAIADYSDVEGSYDSDTADTLLLLMGTNDIRLGRTTAQLIADLSTYCGLAKATGYKVAIGTMLPTPAVGWGSQADRDTVNDWIRDNYGTIADYLMDFAAIPEMADTDDTTVYSDGVHPTGLGYSYMAAEAVAGMGITPLAAHDDNGAPRLRVNPPYWNGANPDTWPTYSLDRMEATFPATGANSVILGVPITTKSAFAFECVSGVGDFVGVGLQIDGVGTAAIGFGPSGSGPGYYNNAAVFSEGSSPNSGLSGISNGDTIGVCVDPTAKKIWWTKDGTNFIGIGSLASLSDVVAGLNSTAQSWAGTPLGAICTFAAAPTLLARSVPYPWTLPSGFGQL